MSEEGKPFDVSSKGKSSGNGMVAEKPNVVGEMQEFGSDIAGREMFVSECLAGSKLVTGETDRFVSGELHSCPNIVDVDAHTEESAPALEVNVDACAGKAAPVLEVNMDSHTEKAAPVPEVNIDSHTHKVALVLEVNVDNHVEKSAAVPEVNVDTQASDAAPVQRVNMDDHTENSVPVPEVNINAHMEKSVPVQDVNMDSHAEMYSPVPQVIMDAYTENSVPPPESMSKSAPTTMEECPQQTMLEQIHGGGSVSVDLLPEHRDVSVEHVGIEPCNSTGQENQLVSDVLLSALAAAIIPDSKCIRTEQPEPPSEALANASFNTNPTSRVGASEHPCTEELGPSSEGHTEGSNIEKLETPAGNAGRPGCKNRKFSRISKKKHTLRPLTNSERVLRSRSQEKPKASESNINSAHVKTSGENPRKKRKRRGKKIDPNEYSRIRKHLRYLLHRISLENSLIDAYSAEGWKGRSLEMVKPEKELERAKSEINRYKLKIRGLFQRVDSLSAEGRLPESLFDSEGEIDSEDIFCAKCGSKDVSADNDIILCDGVCDRGFHQFCLEPPLLKEAIPSGDEGWMCPACDCKVDCIDMVDDSFGTNLSISDSWEKVFPDAVVGQQSDNAGLSSDESDDDYNPDGPDSDERDLESDSSSDESDHASASERLGVPANDKQYFGLSSDDSDDDDFDPDAPDPDVNNEKSSGSDFSSASEDLGATLDADMSSGEEGPLCSSLDGVRGLRGSKSSLRDELASLEESDPVQQGPETLGGKRHIERLDYKRLYDETYGNVPSSSSDDEDYNDIASSRKSRGKRVKSDSNGETLSVKDENNPGTERRSQKRISQKLSIDETNHLPAKAHGSSSISASSSKRVGLSENKRLGESVTKKLYQSFKENQYPKREMKESLATELGLTIRQVSKWFENARWSSRHPSGTDASLSKSISKENTSLQTDKKESGFQQQMINGAVTCSGLVDESGMAGNTAAKNACENSADNKPINEDSCKETPMSRRSSRIRSKQNQPASNQDLGDEDKRRAREGPSEKQTGERSSKRRRAV